MNLCEQILLMAKPHIGAAFGLLVAVFPLGRLVPRIVKAAKSESQFDVNISDPKLKKKWDSIVALSPQYGPKVLGMAECVIIFVSITTSAYVLAAGWLAFKVAAKWAVWQHIIQVPEKLTDPRFNQLEYLHAKHAWGTLLLNGFLVGTAVNIVIAFAGVLVANVVTAMVWKFWP